MLRSTPGATVVAGMRTPGGPPPYAHGMDVRAGSVSEVMVPTTPMHSGASSSSWRTEWSGTGTCWLTSTTTRLPDALAEHNYRAGQPHHDDGPGGVRAAPVRHAGPAWPGPYETSGVPNTEIAGVFGVSRQLVHRILAV